MTISSIDQPNPCDDFTRPNIACSHDEMRIVQVSTQRPNGRRVVGFFGKDRANIVDRQHQAGVWPKEVAKSYAKQLRKVMRKQGIKASVTCVRYNPLSAFAHDYQKAEGF